MYSRQHRSPPATRVLTDILTMHEPTELIIWGHFLLISVNLVKPHPNGCDYSRTTESTDGASELDSNGVMAICRPITTHRWHLLAPLWPAVAIARHCYGRIIDPQRAARAQHIAGTLRQIRGVVCELPVDVDHPSARRPVRDTHNTAYR